MPPVPLQVRRERAARLREVGRASAAAFFEALRGSEVVVLAESEAEGHSEHFAPVRLTAPARPGRIVRARVRGATSEALVAEPV